MTPPSHVPAAVGEGGSTDRTRVVQTCAERRPIRPFAWRAYRSVSRLVSSAARAPGRSRPVIGLQSCRESFILRAHGSAPCLRGGQHRPRLCDRVADRRCCLPATTACGQASHNKPIQTPTYLTRATFVLISIFCHVFMRRCVSLFLVLFYFYLFNCHLRNKDIHNGVLISR